MLKSVSVDERAKTLTIVLDLEEPTPSASGKSLVVASTRGIATSTVQVGGKVLKVGVNAFIERDRAHEGGSQGVNAHRAVMPVGRA